MTKGRWPVIDILRFISFPAVVIYHITYVLWAAEGLDYVPAESFLSRALEVYGRVFAFGGFTVLFLSFFLYGLRSKGGGEWRRLWLLLTAFFLAWALLSGEFPYIWDIYAYLLVAIPLAALSIRWPAIWTVLAGGALLALPFWKLESVLAWPGWLTGPIFGNCSLSDRIGEEWPLLPWIGLPLLALGLGRLTSENVERLRTMVTTETVLWFFLLALSTFWLGGYYDILVGDAFACSMFRRPQQVFWAHLIWILFLVRLGFLPAFAKRLSGRWMEWISSRAVNRRFFIIYFLHYLYLLGWAAFVRETGMPEDPAFTLGVATCLLMAIAPDELYARFRLTRR